MELGAILKEYDAFSVGEMPCVHDEKELVRAVAADRGELSMIFHFELYVYAEPIPPQIMHQLYVYRGTVLTNKHRMDIDHGVNGKFSPATWALSTLKSKVNKWQRFMYDNNGWNALYLENHDQPRAVSRFVHDTPEHRVASAKLIAIFLAFQAGTPFIYQGQEIGMTNVPKEWGMDEYKDIDCLNHWK